MATHEIFAKDETGSLKKCIISAPVGSVIAYPVDDVPDHCLECNGAVISRTTYSELFAVLGTVYGEGDGSTTFAVPDFRDKFLRGSGGVNGAAIGTVQGDATAVNGLSIIMQRSTGGVDSAMPTVNGGNNHFPFNANGDSSRYSHVYSDAPKELSGDIETRPVNYAVKYCIIFE